MRLFKLFIIPVIALTGSIAQAQDYSTRLAHSHPRVSTEFASLDPAPAPAPTAAPAPTPGIIPAQVAIPTPVDLAPAPGPIGYENPQPLVPAPNRGAPQPNGMATFGTPGCAGCAGHGCGGQASGGSCGCSDCGCCLDHVKAWLCYLPARTCKKVCYNPIPQLYLFFPCSRCGYRPILAPFEPCVRTCSLVHQVAPPCKSCCGHKEACGGCGSGATSSPRIRGLLKSSEGGCATPHCPPITAGCPAGCGTASSCSTGTCATGTCATGTCATGGCATGGCAPGSIR